MLRSNSLKLRYLISFWVILVPVALFLTILNHVTTDNNRRYINQVTLERFTYAAENLSTLLDRLDYAAESAQMLEDSILLDDKGAAYVSSIYQAAAALEKLEEALVPEVHVCLHLRGDKYIYTSAGQQLYSDFEASISSRYNLSLSGLYTKMMHVSATRELKAIRDDQGLDGALAYIVPFPSQPLPAQAMLLFLIPAETLVSEFENYLGKLDGDLHIYNAFMQPVFSLSAGDEALVPFDQLIRGKGVGVQEVDDRHIRVTVVNSVRGQNCMLVMDRSVFYGDMQHIQNRMLMLDVILIILLMVMFAWLALFNYQPVRQLVTEVVGKSPARMQTNELELVKNYYYRTVDELESRNLQISEMTPMITQQLVMKLVHGQIHQKAQLDALSRYAGAELGREWFTALYVLAEEDALDMTLRTALRFQQPKAGVITGELSGENALCVILNYDVSGGDEDAAQQEALRMAQALLAQLGEGGRIGVGGAYRDPLRMVDSFAEASAAIHMPQQGLPRVCRYEPGQTEKAGYTGLPPLTASLLTEAVTRGETAVACRAVTELVDGLSRATESFLFFRFYGTELINHLLRLAETLHFTVEHKQMEALISYQSRHEFSQAALQFVQALCVEARRRSDETSSAEKERLLVYLLDHFKEFDLSIQSVADALDMRRSEVAAIIRENMGLNFVQYISGLRMSEFKRLLKETDRSITELVTEVGYSDASNFLRKFKATEGVTAGQYRTQHR